MTMTQKGNRAGESGNVLFLILIAVALFAALSYAVTQSTRSGSGDASGETNLINSAQLAQYPAGVRTSVVRMIIGGLSVDQIGFDAPADFGNTTSDLRYNVFHPTGGGAVFQKAPKDVLAAQSGVASDLGTWIFSSKFQIEGIGSSGNGGNDVIAFLPGVSQNVCKKLNDELGIVANATNTDKIPTSGGTMTTVVTTADMMTETDSGVGDAGIPTTAGPNIGSENDHELKGQPFGCFRIGTSDAAPAAKTYVYYHVLVER